LQKYSGKLKYKGKQTHGVKKKYIDGVCSKEAKKFGRIVIDGGRAGRCSVHKQPDTGVEAGGQRPQDQEKTVLAVQASGRHCGGGGERGVTRLKVLKTGTSSFLLNCTTKKGGWRKIYKKSTHVLWKEGH